MQRLVTVLILDPETPGGLRASMAWRLVSRSATADDMMPVCMFVWRLATWKDTVGAQ